MTMSLTFWDLQHLANPKNGTRLESLCAISELFSSLRGRIPFMFELRGDNGFMLTVGWANDYATIQHSPSEGVPPYLMAVPDSSVDDGGFVEFLAGGTRTPIPRRFCLSAEQAGKIAADFLTHGGKSEVVTWEEV